MTRLRYAVLVSIGAALLTGPLSALCSSCCVTDSSQNAMSAPMPCCGGGSCGPSFTSARPRDPAMTSSKIGLDSPLPTVPLHAMAIEPLVAAGSPGAALPRIPTESPPISTSVLRL